MRRSLRLLSVLAGLGLLAATAYAGRPDSPGGNHGGPRACDPEAVAAAVAAVATACPCDGVTDDAGNLVPWKNHGKYVRCVAHATKRVLAASDAGLTRRCLKESVRCAARSTCGKPEGVVACTSSTSGTCVDGSCDDGDSCTTDEDCSASRCSFSRSAEECAARGGVPGTGSCCDPTPIGSPSGAFVDGVPLL